MIVSDRHGSQPRFAGVRFAPRRAPLRQGGVSAQALRQLAAREGRRLSQGLAQVAYLAGGLSAFFDAGTAPRGAKRPATLGAATAAPWRLDFRRLAFASGFGAFDVADEDLEGAFDAFGAYKTAPDPTSASAQGLVPVANGDSWFQLVENYPRPEIVWAVAWNYCRLSATDKNSGLQSSCGGQGLPGCEYGRQVYANAVAGEFSARQACTASMAYWYAAGRPLPSFFTQNPGAYPGMVNPCDEAVCCWIDEAPAGGGPPQLRMTAGDSSCAGASSYTGSLMRESACRQWAAPRLSKYAACQQKVGAPRGPWLSYLHTYDRSSLKSFNSQTWSNQCARNFLVDPGCDWNPANDGYWKCMLTPEVDFSGAVVAFFNDAWDTVKRALADCFGFDANGTPRIAKPPYACLTWLANNVPQPLGFLFTLILEVPKLASCTANIFSGSTPVEEKVQCFIDVLKEAITQVVNTFHISWDMLAIAANTAIGNIPGAVVTGAKWIVSQISGAITDPDDKAALVAIVSSTDLITMVMAQGLPVFSTEAFWQMLGATLQNAAPGNTALAVVGRALARNAELPAMAIRGEDVAAYVKRKWLDPAVALVQTAARAGTAVVADLSGDGDALHDLGALLTSVADILDGVGDGINSVKILGTAGRDLKRIATNMRKAAATATRVSQLLDRAKNAVGVALSYTPEQVEAMIKAAVAAAAADPTAAAAAAAKAAADARAAAAKAAAEARAAAAAMSPPPATVQAAAPPLTAGRAGLTIAPGGSAAGGGGTGQQPGGGGSAAGAAAAPSEGLAPLLVAAGVAFFLLR